MFEAWTLTQELVTAEEERLREDVRSLQDAEKVLFFKKYNNRLKDPDTYAVLNWFFLAGLHHIYLGKYFRGLINLLIMLLGIIFLINHPWVGMILIVGIILVEIPALFRSQIIVANHNTMLGRQILQKTRHP